jgi:pimeloyl-ACP methyl ester carboxylesterase
MQFYSHRDLQTAYSQGTGPSTIVLVHGLGADRTTWDGVSEALISEHRCLTLDFRGHAASERGTAEYTIDLLADDLEALIAALEVGPEHITLVGHSMGGLIVQSVLGRKGRCFHAAVLASTSSRINAKATQNWRRLADTVAAKGLSTRPETQVRGFSPTFAAENPELLKKLAARNSLCDRAIYAEQARAASEYDFTETLAEVPTPVLVLQGEQDQMTPIAGSVLLDRSLPISRLEIIPEVGHNLHLELEGRFAEMLVNFMSEADQLSRSME